MLHLFDYDSAYSPAMPVAEIAIGRALNTPTLTLIALIDSGADAMAGFLPAWCPGGKLKRAALLAWCRWWLSEQGCVDR